MRFFTQIEKLIVNIFVITSEQIPDWIICNSGEVKSIEGKFREYIHCVKQQLNIRNMNHIHAIVLCLFLSFSVSLKAQVTIGSLDTPDQSALLDLKSENYDKGVLFPNVPLIATWDSLTVTKPATGLLVYNTADSDPDRIINISERVRSDKYYVWSGDEWIELIGNSRLSENMEIAFSALGVPRPALFTLDGSERIMPQYYPNMRGVMNLLQGTAPGNSVFVPMVEQVNLTNGNVKMTNTNGQTKIIFKPGVYEIKFVYEFVPMGWAENNPGVPPDNCTVSSYFMDFPMNRLDGNNVINMLGRVHSNCTHNKGILSDHGSTINYVTTILKQTTWNVRLGRGAAGNCNGVSGFAMPNRSTFLYISRVGDLKLKEI